ncbi:stealth conserved region 3 domain-containing protein [Streptomyces yaanensis]|uniref:Stealth conserved region 3 domain-containing protein n=1 Tax=Streptomyces yaanensis TaxID=1142239 RepID=A0ABV7SCN7_9ACTN|nr:stealth conserved region 3 domain-containing protein [Streptomyces sp. CGMCC 4.7035]WNB98452.1 stealth conserved region 3 domain-containing protein [Streptomyces sp. CGMCC 4.7035]
MRVAFLLAQADVLGDAERAVFGHATELADRHDVRIISVFKARRRRFAPPDPRVPVTFLIESPQSRAVRRSGLDAAASAALTALPSEIVERRWDDRFNRLADIELEYLLHDIDVDVLVTTSPALLAYAARFAPPDVMTVHHELRVPEVAGPAVEPLLRHITRCDAVTLPCARSQEWFTETFGPGTPPLAVVPPALAEGFRPRSTLETRMVTLVARLEETSGVAQALAAWAQVSPLHPTWTLRVIGDGPLGRSLTGRRDQLGLHSSVQFVGEAPPVLAEEWAKASIALSTAREDALGLSLREAQAAGVPVVAYDCPNAPREVVYEGHTGLLATPDDTDALVAALLNMMENAEMRWSMGNAAVEAAQRFRPTDQWDQLFAALDADRAAGRRAELKAERVAAHALVSGVTGQARAAAAAPRSTRHTSKLEAAEERLLKQKGALVRDGGQVCRVVDAETPFDIVQANLAMTASALEAARIPYFVTRTTKVRHSVAVHSSHREAVLKALAQSFQGQAVYMALLNDADASVTTTLAGLATDYLQTGCSGVRIYQSVVTPSRTLRLGAAYGCTIAFWDDDPEDPESIVSPFRTLIGGRVPKAALRRVPMVLGGRQYPTLEAFSQTLHHDIAFPIDAVYTWVDGADISWLERKNAVLAAKGIETEDAATSAARFRNRDELRYSLRSLDMYAPWIRNIYLVTDRQVPSWLDTSHPRVRVVDHTEIFGNEGALPTYNSHAIESRLHHIEGLAEHFLYFNDDVFAARPIQPSLFFLGNGQSKHFMSSNAIPMNPIADGDEFSRMAAKNNRQLVSWMFGRTLVNSFIHAPHPLRRSVMFDLEKQFPDALRNTAHNQLRDASDVSVASSLHHYFGYYTGRSVPGGISSGFVNVGLSGQVKKLNHLLAERSNDVFCLNDFHDGDISEDEQDATLAAFLPSYFPIASQFEAGSPRNQLFHAGSLPGWPL